VEHFHFVATYSWLVTEEMLCNCDYYTLGLKLHEWKPQDRQRAIRCTVHRKSWKPGGQEKNWGHHWISLTFLFLTQLHSWTCISGLHFILQLCSLHAYHNTIYP